MLENFFRWTGRGFVQHGLVPPDSFCCGTRQKTFELLISISVSSPNGLTTFVPKGLTGPWMVQSEIGLEELLLFPFYEHYTQASLPLSLQDVIVSISR